MERQSLSIRQFADVCSVSHTEIARKMKALNIEGSPQGPGKPTLLSPDEQDQIAQTLFIPAEQPPAPQHQTEVMGRASVFISPPAWLPGAVIAA